MRKVNRKYWIKIFNYIKFIFKISQPLDWETGIQQVKP